MAKSVLSPWRQIINFRCSLFTSGVTRFFSLMKTLFTYAQKKEIDNWLIFYVSNYIQTMFQVFDKAE